MGSQHKPPSLDLSNLYPLPALPTPSSRPVEPAAVPVTPPVTPPLPGQSARIDPERPGYDPDGPWVVTGIREYDGAMEWELPRDGVRFLGGASQKRCEIWLPERGLSATHFMLERRERILRLYDLHSSHGIWIMDSPVTTADLRPGSKFTARPVTFVTMNDAMRRSRPELVDILGARWLHSPDWLMVEAAGSGHMVIIGEAGCEQERLAEAIHEMSPRQARDLIELEVIPQDRGMQVDIVRRAAKDGARVAATVMLRLRPGAPRLDDTFLSMLYAPAYGIRVIVLANTSDDARRALGEGIDSLCQHVLLRPLAYRKDEIDQLLDRRFAVRNAAHLRAADLLDENQAALQQHSWPGNLAELRLVADILTAYETEGGWRGVGRAIDKPRSTMQDHFDRIGLKTMRLDGGRRGAPRFSFFKPSPGETAEPGSE
jgi:hypothetical protein